MATAGASPLLQFNTPYNYMQTQNLNELAENVVSTVKSGLFRAATGILFGSGGGSGNSEDGTQSKFMTEEQRRRRDPEQKLTMTQAFKDHMKQARRHHQRNFCYSFHHLVHRPRCVTYM